MTDTEEMILVPRKHIATMAVYISGGTPDRNTQTQEEVARTMEVVSALSRLYDPYSTEDCKKLALEILYGP